MKMLSRLCSVFLGVVAIIFLVAGLWADQQAPSAPPDTIYTVDTEADLIDTNLADGLCPVGSCSLRAAIMQANVMQVPGVTIIVLTPRWLGAILLAVGIAAGGAAWFEGRLLFVALRARSLRLRDERLRKATTGR